MVLFGSKPTKEKKLEKKGKFHELQLYRYKMARGEGVGDFTYRLPRLLQTEQRLREITQREATLTEEIKRGLESGENIEEMDRESQDLKSSYYAADCEWHLIYTRIVSEYLKRGLSQCRSYPQWYLHEILSKDCADRDGCCARDCGCCRTRDVQPNRQLGVGHCTLECGCCQETRGFAGCKLSDEAKESMKDICPLDRDTSYRYYQKIMKASIFGIADGNVASQLDLIEKPPAYEEKEFKPGR
ncbi:hypothetical protein N7456_006335 [Penicillium angulare]|uniref:Uncharacterized protein n=1 Tax=Penicillium angulare TaxID=116970 RepID=A0A9W9FHF5_9EURO|nr:hypothetical protein N7456_006335 [Penicillium angulare]